MVNKFVEEIFSLTEELIQYLNDYFPNPYDYIEVPDEFYEHFPIHWDIAQLALVLGFIYQREPFPALNMLITNKKKELLGFALIYSEDTRELTGFGYPVLNFHYIRQDLKDVEKSFIDKVENKIKNHKTPVKEFEEFWLNTKKVKLPQNIKSNNNNNNYNEENWGNIIHTLMIEIEFLKMIKNLRLPLANLNLLQFINTIVGLKTSIADIIKSDEFLFYFNQFHQNDKLGKLVDKIYQVTNGVDLDNWADVWLSLLNGLSLNLIIVDKDLPLIACKIVVDEVKIAINPIPMDYFETHLECQNPSAKYIKDLYQTSKISTLILDIRDIDRYLGDFIKPDSGMYEIFTGILSLVYSGKWYPDSLLNSFLKLFGFQLGPGIRKIPEIGKIAISYFERALIVTYNYDEDSKTPELTLLEILGKPKKSEENEKDNHSDIENNSKDQIDTSIKVDMILIDSSEILKNLNKQKIRAPKNATYEYFESIKKEVEKIKGYQYSVLFGVDLQVIAQSMSAKNIKALIEMNDLYYQFPLIASIGGLFAGMKALGSISELDDKESPLIELSSELKAINQEVNEEILYPAIQKNPMKFANFFDQFLKKGMFVILEGEYTDFEKLRQPDYSKKGYLGFDLPAIRELILKTDSQKKEPN